MIGSLAINWATPFWLLAIYGAVRFFTKKPSKKAGQINWKPFESIAVALAIYFAGQFAAALIIYSIPLIAGVSQQQITNWLNNNIYGQFLFILAVESLTFWLLFNFIKRRHSNLMAIGLNRKPLLKDVGYVVVGFVIYFIAYLLAISIFKQLFPRVNESQQQIVGFSGASSIQLPFVFVSLVILPPLLEETLVRGFLYSGLKKGWPILWAAFVTSLLFGIAHLQAGSGEPLLWTAGLDTFVLSFVLVYLKEKTGSLWASIGLHMLKNLIAFFSLFVFHLV